MVGNGEEALVVVGSSVSTHGKGEEVCIVFIIDDVILAVGVHE